MNQLNSEVGLRALEGYAASGNEPREQGAAAIRRLAHRLRLATEQANEPARRIRPLAQTELPSLDPPVWHRPAPRRRSGRHLGPPTSRRPSNDALLTAHTGVAPLETSSTGIIRHRLDRMASGKSTRSCTGPPSHKASEGTTAPEALCIFKRHSVRAIWRLRGCRADEAVRQMVKWPDSLHRSVRKCTAMTQSQESPTIRPLLSKYNKHCAEKL